MRLRNLDTPTLCKSTRLVRLFRYLIDATISIGEYTGQDVLSPGIPLIPSDCPIEFQRLQFPVALSYAMSINNSQGQSLQNNINSSLYPYTTLLISK